MSSNAVAFNPPLFLNAANNRSKHPASVVIGQVGVMLICVGFFAHIAAHKGEAN